MILVVVGRPLDNRGRCDYIEAMTLSLFTLTSSDHYQHYLPLWAYCARKYVGRDIDIACCVVNGAADKETNAALHAAGFEDVCEVFTGGVFPACGYNLMRFLTGDTTKGSDATLICDADLLLTENPFPWHLAQLDATHCFASHHGPRRKPYRPEVSGPEGWRGDWERTAGGFVLVTPEWYAKTLCVRKKYLEQLHAGALPEFRELDEVILSRIIKESGMEVPQSKFFPPSLRGVHIGDFKDSMTHRWTNMAKMVGKLTTDNCVRFRELEADPVWQKMLRILGGDTTLMRELSNVRAHMASRGV